ncbi:MAG: hypothetical protein WAK42_06770 [Mycobacterium sp.]
MAAATGTHPRKGEFRAGQYATEVDGDLKVGKRVGFIREQSHMLNARVVHHDLQRTESVFHLVQK